MNRTATDYAKPWSPTGSPTPRARIESDMAMSQGPPADHPGLVRAEMLTQQLRGQVRLALVRVGTGRRGVVRDVHLHEVEPFHVSYRGKDEGSADLCRRFP